MKHITGLTSTAGAHGPAEAQTIDPLTTFANLIAAVAGVKQAALDLLGASQPGV